MIIETLNQIIQAVTEIQNENSNLTTQNNILNQSLHTSQQETLDAQEQIHILTPPEWLKKADAIFKTGYDLIGMPYIFGEEYPKGFDCSSFTQFTFAKNGIALLRTSYQQVTQGVAVRRELIRKGDLVFFNFKVGTHEVDHVGIADGKGNMLQTNDPTKPIRLSAIPTAGYVTARRIIGG